MFKILIFFCTFFLSLSSYAQKNDNYFKTIAGDTAISFTEKIIKEDLGDTITLDVIEGLYRIVLNEGILLNQDIDIQVFTDQGQMVELIKNDNYIDFYISTSNNLRFIYTANKVIENVIIADLFWVYNKNTLSEAPLFKLKDIEGNEYSNTSLIGKIVVINFWGIWCRPCVREIPLLNRLVKQYEDREDVVFIALSYDPVDKLNDFIQKTPFNYRLITDKRASVLNTKFINPGIITFPSHAILDKNGNIIFQYIGENHNIGQILANCIEKQK